MSDLPGGLEQAFMVAAGELGMCGAAWLFAENVAQDDGDRGVASLRDTLGRSFPVLDAVAERWLEGDRRPRPDPAPALAACANASRVVVVGLEAFHLDALVAGLGRARCGLIQSSPFDVDWERALSNYDGRVEPLELEHFQAWAGPSSVLLTFAYGVQGHSTHVVPAWLRVIGEDVRTQFRSLVAWDVLRAPMFVYPRWLVEVPLSVFTDVA